jgi:hypothetical protein
MSELWNTTQTAERLGVSKGTLEVWRCTRRYPLRYLKIGGKVRYRPADVERFLTLRTHPGVAEQPPARRRRRAR